ncbi:MAG: DUF1533 domain-containing protein [Tissierellia bacterium]|nr:DUF1533 domain-containing protein [Tissierellia bacterium]
MKKTIAWILLLALFLPGVAVFANSPDDFNVKIVTVADTVSYLAIDGKNLKSEIKGVALDGKDVKFSKVSDDGQLVKTEFDGPYHKLTLTLEDGRILSKDILGLYSRFPYKSSGNTGAPDMVWGHVTVPVWDFHTVAKDGEGNEIRFPGRNTFEVNEEAQPIDAISAPTTITNVITDFTKESHTIPKGQDIIFSYDMTEGAKGREFLRLMRINLVNEDSSLERISFTKVKDEGTGKVTISLENNLSLKDLDSATLKLYFRGLRAKDVHIQFKEVASHEPEVNPNPEEVITENTIDYGKDIVLNFDLSDSVESRKYMRLMRINKLYDDGHEERLSFTKTKSDNKGLVTISFDNSRPIQQRGQQKIKLIYRGYRPDEKDFILKDKAPVMKWNSNNGEYKTNKSLLFTLDGFEYIFQHITGVQSVYLNGQKLERRYVVNPGEDLEDLIAQGVDAIDNESGNPFHVINDLLRIKNHGLDALKPGINFITVKYDTYHDSNFKFVLEGDKAVEVNEPVSMMSRSVRSIDMMSSATSGGVSKPSIGGDGSGGTVNMGATLVYNFDMVANAKIVETLGYKDPGAKKILDFWEGTAKEVAVMKDNPHRKVVWDEYMNFVQDNRLNHGVYKSFKEYFNDPSVATTLNAPYQVKFALPNGFGAPIFNLREIFDYTVDEEMNIPEAVLRKLDHVAIRTDIVLPLNEWTANIEKIVLNGVELVKDKDYKINTSNNELTIFGKVFAKDGNYRLVISSLGFKDLEKDILIKSEVAEDTMIRLRLDTYPNGNLFTGEDLKFEVMDLHSRVTGASIFIDGELVKELSNGNGYSYTPSLGQLNIHGKEVRKPGQYTIRFYLAGKSFKEVSFQVIGPEITFVKAPINNTASFRLNGNMASLTLENHTGNRDIVAWIDSIQEVRVNGVVAPISNDLNAPLRYEITRNEDEQFDKSAKLYITSNFENMFGKNGPVKIEVIGNDYATVVFEYEVVNGQPVEKKNINIYQMDPKTGEIAEGYNKFDYIEKVEEETLVPPFDEEEMARNFPGMVWDWQNKVLKNDGSMEGYGEFLDKIVKVEKNGEKINFAPNGVLVDYYGISEYERSLRFYIDFKEGDIISIQSDDKVYEFMIK